MNFKKKKKNPVSFLDSSRCNFILPRGQKPQTSDQKAVHVFERVTIIIRQLPIKPEHHLKQRSSSFVLGLCRREDGNQGKQSDVGNGVNQHLREVGWDCFRFTTSLLWVHSRIWVVFNYAWIASISWTPWEAYGTGMEKASQPCTTACLPSSWSPHAYSILHTAPLSTINRVTTGDNLQHSITVLHNQNPTCPDIRALYSHSIRQWVLTEPPVLGTRCSDLNKKGSRNLSFKELRVYWDRERNQHQVVADTIKWMASKGIFPRGTQRLHISCL